MGGGYRLRMMQVQRVVALGVVVWLTGAACGDDDGPTTTDTEIAAP